VQIHQGPARLFALGFFPCVDEQLGEGTAVRGVVRAASPLEVAAAADSTDASPGSSWTDGRSLADRLVTAAAVEVARAAGASDGVGDTRRRYGMHERHLPNTCRKSKHAIASEITRLNLTRSPAVAEK